ncbi:polysaccharide deacetylase family protein [Actinomadura sp. ATCC 31491]|uniref:Polysaccharide deacetylase family protein n=1 Tax=Actinomadura luzonensis TaxID=2805427 RepID=A0ABT0G7N3_9ACTN|nr:polysaccharide deacetylase family protein [Actinomadura luzonensis]MCK2220123.1 polysaccharide deacetylase family protein [Actinomadura luzonensis]
MSTGARRGSARVAASVVLTAAALATVSHRPPPAGTVQAATRDAAGPARADAATTRNVPASATTAQAGTGQDRAAQAGPARDRAATARGRAVDCRRVKCVALTFDDGPGPYTDTLLRHLAAYDARATFFVVGQNVAAYPSVLRRAVAAGHEIGNHTWSHPDLTKLSAARVRAQVARDDQAIRDAAGLTPALVRPPYGAFDATVRAQVKRPLVLWSVDTLDWLHRDSARVARVAIRSARPGSVILFHDIHPTTVRAVPRVLKALSRQGYAFVTVSRLFGGRPPRLVYSGGAPDQL